MKMEDHKNIGLALLDEEISKRYPGADKERLKLSDREWEEIKNVVIEKMKVAIGVDTMSSPDLDNENNTIAANFETCTKVVGVTKKNENEKPIQEILPYLDSESDLHFGRDWGNNYDPNAILVYADGEHIGYLKKELAAEISPFWDSHIEYELDGKILEITGGDEKIYGCNIEIWFKEITDSRELERRKERKAIRDSILNKHTGSVDKQSAKNKAADNKSIKIKKRNNKNKSLLFALGFCLKWIGVIFALLTVLLLFISPPGGLVLLVFTALILFLANRIYSSQGKELFQNHLLRKIFKRKKKDI